MQLYFNKPTKGYHFNESDIKVIEKNYGAKFVGSFSIKSPRGGWNPAPVDVFYQPTPDFSKGHSHYFGMFYHRQNGDVMITDARSAFERPIMGVVAEDGEVVVSGYTHDFRTSKDKTVSIDGGRDYTKVSGINGVPELVRVAVEEDRLVVLKE